MFINIIKNYNYYKKGVSMTKNKVSLPVSIDESLADWIVLCARNSEFRNRSHLVEQAILDFKKRREHLPSAEESHE
jgi:metal-responsive CopG/Arc/MetJ family transcriptional regulator